MAVCVNSTSQIDNITCIFPACMFTYLIVMLCSVLNSCKISVLVRPVPKYWRTKGEISGSKT